METVDTSAAPAEDQATKDAADRQAAVAKAVADKKEADAKAVEGIGDVVVVIGRKALSSASEEDPAIVNLVTEFPVLPPKPTVFIDGIPQPKPVPTKPENVIGYVAATLFPQGLAPQTVRNVPLYATREEAVAARGDHPPTAPASNPDLYLVAYRKP